MAQSNRYSRRKLLSGMGLGGVGIAAASVAGPAAAFTGDNPLAAVLPGVLASLRDAGYSDWSSAVGSSFLVRGEAGAASVQLVGVREMKASGARPAGLRASSFALFFQGTDSATFPRGNRTYAFEQNNGNQLQLFVGGKAVAGTTAQLIAVMN
jgi:hypothetical protein